MFKFNFPCDGQTDTVKISEPEINDSKLSIQEVVEGREIEISSQHRESIKQYRENGLPPNVVRDFYLVDLKQVEELVSQNSGKFEVLSSALQMNSDLLAGVYEGGLKIWECTLDLLDYLENQNVTFSGLNVLDLGCGAGILGMYALNKGASSVHFQDYNAEVLDLVTIPNVLLNEKPENQGKTRYFSGDWGSLAQKLDIYDIVLTSETIYNPENYSKLIQVFEKTIKKDGIIYVAAKHHYFGVGGNLLEFEKILRKNEQWDTSICFCSDEGVKREILKISQKMECKN